MEIAPYKYGFIYTSFNDYEILKFSFDSLKSTIPSGDNWTYCVVDAGSNPEQLKLIKDNIGNVLDKPYPHLSQALNAGYYKLLEENCDYITWLHGDMAFHQYDWTKKLISIYQNCYPLIAKLGPTTSIIDSGINELQQNRVAREGNQQPHVMSAEFLHIFIKKHGYVFDPRYLSIFGVEDMQMWWQILEMGMLVSICSLVDVVHLGAATRFLRDTSEGQKQSRTLFHSIWGHDIFPTCTFDPTELDKELLDKFGYLKDEVINNIPKRDQHYKELKAVYEKMKQDRYN